MSTLITSTRSPRAQQALDGLLGSITARDGFPNHDFFADWKATVTERGKMGLLHDLPTAFQAEWVKMSNTYPISKLKEKSAGRTTKQKKAAEESGQTLVDMAAVLFFLARSSHEAYGKVQPEAANIAFKLILQIAKSFKNYGELVALPEQVDRLIIDHIAAWHPQAPKRYLAEHSIKGYCYSRIMLHSGHGMDAYRGYVGRSSADWEKDTGFHPTIIRTFINLELCPVELQKSHAFLIPEWIKMVRLKHPHIQDETGDVVSFANQQTTKHISEVENSNRQTLEKFGKHWDFEMGEARMDKRHDEEEEKFDFKLVSALLDLIRLHLSSF